MRRNKIKTESAEMTNEVALVEAEPPRGAYIAAFDELVDLVVDNNGGVAFLVKQNGKLSVCTTFKVGDLFYFPPPIDVIPFKLPRVNEVLKHYDKQNNLFKLQANEKLFDIIFSRLKKVSELPSDKWYLLATAWVFHTYFQEQVNYSPIISMVAEAERGKSRSGKAMIHTAYRGIHFETLRDAHIIRQATNFNASMFFDVRNISQKIHAGQSEDIFLHRFEKGPTVLRVDKKQSGRFVDTVYYSVFGPTIIASNVGLDNILESRVVQIIMPLSNKIFTDDLKPEDALPLKEQLVAFRARYLGVPLPIVEKPTTGRLGDIMCPLLQVVKLVVPRRVKEFLELVKDIENKRKLERSLSIEAEIILTIDAQKTNSNNGMLGVQLITDSFNSNRESYSKLTPQKIGRTLGLLGFDKGKLGNGNSAIIINDKLIRNLKSKYGFE